MREPDNKSMSPRKYVTAVSAEVTLMHVSPELVTLFYGTSTPNPTAYEARWVDDAGVGWVGDVTDVTKVGDDYTIEVEHIQPQCHVCNQRCEGTTGAVIDDVFQPMCHHGESPTCYEKWASRGSPKLLEILSDPDHFTKARERHRRDIIAERERKR